MHSAQAAALVAALLPFVSPSSLTAQTSPKSDVVQRIVLLDHTLPDRDALRAAIRAHDPAAAAQAANEVESGARLARREFEDALERVHGRILRNWWIIDGVLVELPADAVDALSALPQVKSVWENATRAPGDAHVAPAPILTSTNFNNHNSDSVNVRGIKGAGVTVAVIDSGLDSDMAGIGRPHKTFFLQGNPGNQNGGGIGGSRMLANVQVGAQSADDPIDHGTRIAGVCIGAKWNTGPNSDDGHAPEARVVGYSLVDLLSGGLTVLATMVQAWQDCTLDAATFGTKVAVTSYEGTNDPLSPEQAAMDACSDLADILISAMAGNSPTVQAFYQGATNILTVGATQQDNRVVAGFSARGPLISQVLPPRRYPSCIANGDLITLPSANAEATDVTRSGTSYAAPQVAGAAALFRSISNVSADATRAAIAVTLEDARGQNAAATDGVGLGYLRDDRLCDVAQGRLRGTIVDGSVDLFHTTWTTTVTANAGEVWAVALAWSRRDVSRVEWANLDLRVSLNGRELGASRSTIDTMEFCVVQPDVTGTLQVEVSATSFEIGRIAQDFGVAAARCFRPLTASYGIGCESHRSAAGVTRDVEPFSLSSVFANSSSDLLLGGLPHRTLQWITTPNLFAAFTANGIAFRRDEAAASWPRSWIELSMTLSLTEQGAPAIVPNFTQNYGPRTSQVIARRTFVLPPFAAPAASPSQLDVTLPFDRPFDRLFDPFQGGVAQSLMIDAQVFGTSAGTSPLGYPLDATLGFAGANSLFAPSPTATTGTVQPGIASVFGLVTGYGSGVVPTLTARTVPALGSSFGVQISNSPASTPVLLFIGASNLSFGGSPLPIELGPVGARGCYALTSMDLSIAGATNASGIAAFNVPVPNSISIRGRSVFEQGFVADPLVNALGFCTTAGLQATFGQ
ncbi:MAG: S8/S53 family peptidase [Planctomycetota bacterium]